MPLAVQVELGESQFSSGHSHPFCYDPCLGHTPLIPIPLSLSCSHTLPISPFAFIHSFLPLLLALSLSLLFSSLFLHQVLTYSLLSFLSFSLHTDLTSKRQASRRRRPSSLDSRQRSCVCNTIPRETPFTPFTPSLTWSLAANRTSGGSSNLISRCRRND
jgi:hypothetical protein